jgi:hypothetical protein
VVTRASSLHPRSSPQASLSEATQPFLLGTPNPILHTHKLSPRNGIGSRHQPYASFKWPIAKGEKSSQGAHSGFLCCSSSNKYKSKPPSSQLYHNTTALPGILGLRFNLTSRAPLESMGKLLSFPYQRPTSDPIPEQVALTTQPIVLEEGEIETQNTNQCNRT